MINLSKTYNALDKKKSTCCAENAVELEEFNEGCQINLAEICQSFGMLTRGLKLR